MERKLPSHCTISSSPDAILKLNGTIIKEEIAVRNNLREKKWEINIEVSLDDWLFS